MSSDPSCLLYPFRPNFFQHKFPHLNPCSRFAHVNHAPVQDQQVSPEHHELSNMTATTTNPFLASAAKPGLVGDGYQSTALVEGQRPSVTSADFSEGSDFVEGRSEVKINEYQAAWNVTNAIQVKMRRTGPVQGWLGAGGFCRSRWRCFRARLTCVGTASDLKISELKIE